MIYETVAAVDLGSNSFRLQVGRVVDNQIYTLDSMKEPVRLASGLMADKRLDAASQARALDGLRRFGERLGGLDSGAVRAVATNTLRVAKNAAEFLPLAEEALGFPIEIIAGREEARLIYIGASHSLPMAAHKRLVVDIGGGSTEFIIGKRHEPQLMESLYMGCVSYTLRFFPDRKIDKRRLREAQVAAAKEIELIAHDYQRMGWKEAVGSSGTARAIADVLELNTVFRQRGYRKDMGVKGAVAVLFNRRFIKSKKAATSNWANARLSEAQLVYAANDAWAALRVFNALHLTA